MSRETDYNIFRATRGARDEVCGAKRWGGRVVAFLPTIWLLIWPDLCGDRKKGTDKMIFVLKKCEKKLTIHINDRCYS